jgi:hypothetical protein
MFEEIEFGSGRVVLDDCEISIDKPLKEQLDFLKEDLFQIEYSEGYIIDVGWYPSFEAEGNFRIVVVSEYNWEKPLYMKKCKELETLTLYMKECVTIVKDLINKG